jgi:hypothetical protein
VVRMAAHLVPRPSASENPELGLVSAGATA